MDILRLWDACNNQGWFVVRRELLDSQLQPPFPRQLWDRNRASGELDGMVDDQRRSFIDRWIDDFLKSGVEWREILSTLAEWSSARKSYAAFRVLALAIEHAGTRDDLASLRAHQVAAEHPASELLADIEFAVRRRTVH
jgi:hypothetical protein